MPLVFPELPELEPPLPPPRRDLARNQSFRGIGGFCRLDDGFAEFHNRDQFPLALMISDQAPSPTLIAVVEDSSKAAASSGS